MGRQVTLEELSGTGSVFDSQGTAVLPDRRYDITITQNMTDASSMSGPAEVAGHEEH